MRIRLNPIAFLALLAAVIAAFAFAIDHWRERPVLSDAQLVASLPSQGATTVFFANLAVLRVAALIKALAGIKPAEEKDYTAFVNQTQFDYTRDVDLLTGSAGNGRWFFLARGRFDWNKLSRYAEAHGGTCQGRMCSVPASEPGRWASFEQIQPALLALAVTPEKDAVRQWPGVKDRVSHLPSSEPAWVEISPDLLKNPAGWPAALRIFAIALQSADSVMISLGPARAQSGEAFDIQLDAKFANGAAAEATRKQLQLETKMLQLALLRSHDQPSAGDLTGLLTAGSFQSKQDHVYATWPVSWDLIKQLE